MKNHFQDNCTAGAKRAGGERGFTVVEVLVALIIFSIAIAGVITVAVQGGIGVNDAKNTLAASYLTDEGIELMRGMRDTAVTGAPTGGVSAAWTAFETAATAACGSSSTASCDIDVTNASGSSIFPAPADFVACPPAGCTLYYDPATGYYNDQGIGSPSIYTRSITVVPVSGTSDEVVVTSTVRWNQGITPESSVDSEDLFNWYF